MQQFIMPVNILNTIIMVLDKSCHPTIAYDQLKKLENELRNLTPISEERPIDNPEIEDSIRMFS